MSLISVNNLTFAYDGSYDNIFENVSFQIDTDWRLGFIGRNGRGKTTFLNLLLGKYEYSGNISASVEFEYFPYPVPDMEKTAYDIVADISSSHQDWELFRELSLLDVDIEALYRPFNTLSNGERTKILLAALFLRENSFLLIDEPTNHLDMAGREKVSEYLSGKKGFILVSHDRAFLDGCIDHVLSINKANIDVQKGNFSSWYHNKELQDNYELEENERLKADISRLTAAAKQSSRWASKVESTKIGKGSIGVEKCKDSRAYTGEQSRRMQQRRKNLERRQQTAIEDKSKLLKNIERNEELKLHTLLYHASRLVILRGVSISYDGRKNVISDMSFTVEQGERIALAGKNGSGKSSLIKLIMGESIPHTGEVNIASRLKISYVPQDASFLRGSLDDYARECQIELSLFKTILRKLDFSRVQFEKDMKDFSGGQKKKVLIARSLSEEAHLYIWDEPMNFIDVLSRIQIEKLVREYRPTLLFVEHDRRFCEDMATKTVNLA